MKTGWLLLVFLTINGPSLAGEDIPVFLQDPIEVDPEFPPRMWTDLVKSGDSQFYFIAYLADGEGPHPTAILLHGFPGNEKNLDLAQAIRRVGWNAVFINFRGSWGSPGNYSVENSNEDVANAIAYMKDQQNAKNLRADPEKIALLGHSFGGFNAFYGAVNNDVACVVGIAAIDIGHHIRRVENGERSLWPWIRKREMIKGYTREIAWEEFTKNRDAFYVLEYGPRLVGTPTLIIIPEFDGAVSVARQKGMAKAFEAEGVDVTMEVIEGADHSFSSRRIALMKTVTDWLNGPCLDQ